MLRWLMTLVALLQQLPPSASPAAVHIPAEWSAHCRVEPGLSPAPHSGESVVDCASRGLLVCDFPGTEPVDLPVQDLCAGKFPAPRAGRVVTLISTTESAGKVQWLTIGPDAQVTPDASRPVLLGKSSIVVSDDRWRLLRITRSDASPVTVSAAEVLAGGASWAVPDAVPGGELLVVAARGPERITSISLDGTPLPVQSGDGPLIVARRGLRPGRYHVRPAFEGGARGAELTGDVTAGSSTVISLLGSDRGEIEVHVDARSCLRGSGSLIISVSAPPVGILTAVVTDGVCNRRFAGLLPGSYEVIARDRDETVFRETITVAAGRSETVEIKAPTVAGVVELNGVPAPELNVVLRDTRGGNDDVPIRIQTGSDGTFLASVPRFGMYEVSFESSGMELVGHATQLSVDRSRVSIRWSLSGGEVSIDVHDWTRQHPLTVRLTRRHPEGAGVGSVGVVLDVGASLPVVIRGVPFAEYLVTAETQSGDKGFAPRAVRQTAELSLRASSPREDVRLKLRPYQARLLVRDSSGQPIPGAIVRAGDTGVPEASPGTFHLNDLEGPHTELLVSASGYEIKCISSPPAGDVVAALRLGIPLRMTFRVAQADKYTAPPGRVRWSESGCPVSLQTMVYLREEPPDSETLIFTFPSFPAIPSFEFAASPYEGPSTWSRFDRTAGIIIDLRR